MLTTLLTRADVSRNTDALALLAELKAVLLAGGGASDASGARHPSIPATSLTLHRGERSLLHLFDGSNGKLLAVMEASGLQTLRASLVAALAADVLAAPEAKKVALLGGGPGASGALKALRLVRSLREGWLMTADLEQSMREAAHLHTTLKTPVHAVEREADAVASADVVFFCGDAKLPECALWPSVHLSVPSVTPAAEPPLTRGMLAKAWLVSDGAGAVWGLEVQATLGQLLGGSSARPPGVTTLFAGASPPWLDLVAAWHVYQGARGDEALTRLDFEA